MRVWKMKSIVASHQKLTITNWKDHWSWTSYHYTRSCWSVNHSKIIQHLKQIGKWKTLIRGCLMSWLKIKKKNIILLTCHLLLFYPTTLKHFSTGLWHATNSGFYDNQWWPAQWSDWEEVPKHFLKPNLQQKKVMVTVRWSTARLIHYSFLNPGETTALRSMLSKLLRCTESSNACPWRWSTEGPNSSPRWCLTTSHNPCFKSRVNWAIKFCLISHIHLTCR